MNAVKKKSRKGARRYIKDIKEGAKEGIEERRKEGKRARRKEGTKERR